MLKASLIFLTYNQETFVQEAIVSVLNQDYENIEIIISDDGSTDQTLAIIERTVSAHPRGATAVFLPKEVNMGLVKNWNRAVKAATGEILIAAAGDDISEPTRASSLVKIFEADSGVMATFSQVCIIEASGQVLHETFEKRPPKYSHHVRADSRTGFNFWCGVPILGACGAYRRELSEVFGPITDAHSEDEPYIYRALLLGAVVYTPKNLVRWRWHGLNLSAGSLTDESDASETLTKMAAMSVRRIDACRQHTKDLQTAHSLGYLGDKDRCLEMRTIDSLMSIHRLSFHTLSPQSSIWAWIKAVVDHLSCHQASRQACGHVIRSFIKRISTQKFKLKYSRVIR